MPTEDDLENYLEAIAEQHHVLGEEQVWSAMDGLKLYLEEAGDPVI